MVMEIMKGGELLDRIIQQSHFSEKEAANIVYVLVSGWMCVCVCLVRGLKMRGVLVCIGFNGV